MKKVLFIAILIVSGVFTSCTDPSEELIDSIENETQLGTGGQEDHDPNPDPDEE